MFKKLRVSLLLLALPAFIGATAYTPSYQCPGYKLGGLVQNDNSFSADLTLAGKPCNIYGNDITNLNLQVKINQGNSIRVQIIDKDQKQFQIPETIVEINSDSKLTGFADLSFNYVQHPSAGFGFQISRAGEVIFDTTGYPLVFEDQYLELISKLPHNANIYGMGETPDYFRRDSTNSTKTLWARDIGDPFRENVYGSHSIYMENRNGKFHGSYMHNSHGMDINLIDDTIQYRMLGGVIDISFFGGPTAYDVINAYTDFVGRPRKIPYWTLGFHNCRWGYKSIDEVDQVIANYSKANIPLEVMWIDIDYMDRTRDFTFDPVNFEINRIQDTLNNLHANNQKMVMMVDPAIQRNSSYGPYARGIQDDVFIKNQDGSNYVGQVWPGYTVYPDWFAPNVDKWWSNEFNMFFDQIELDGVWIDMNEVSSFCTGSCGSGIPEDVVPEWPWTIPNPPPPRTPNVNNTFLVPKYTINNHQNEISEKGIDTISVHANGLIDYHVHNLYGHMMAQHTSKFLKTRRPNIKPFLLTRSTFAGSGAYADHWNGDNASNWDNLHVSISSMLDFGIFGIPFIGSDICGFNGNTTEQLCGRWTQVGAFYPFSRVHNAKGQISQELYRWDSVAESARRALNVRYSLLPYYYTKHHIASTIGTPVARPLVFEFSNDANTFAIDAQFMIGEGILISPVVSENATTVDAYIPKGIWYDWYNYSPVVGMGQNVTLDAPINHVNVHIRGGSIIPTQTPGKTVEDSRKNNFTLIVASDENGNAQGELYLDDGITYDSPSSMIKFTFDGKTLVSSGSYGYNQNTCIEKVVILYGTDNCKQTTLNNVSLSLNCGWQIQI
ncbi:hypothetical protein BB558_001309 [Smittium angustum]|uniref:Probable alpha/beta-glucosidase agdC n=1 Tax=Smittium angustum TaxID=133377 RepID=A0A2U1JBV6_SMIAN|nr:hypothetical protein BB558_003948 [Smittium angustum]PWA02504.1 hypothetical protein BB558_001309 [Smittium angustum]